MVTVGLCFMVALMEGLDLQAAGIAAVGMAQAFALDKMQMGWIFSAGILGLLPGALAGGMLADRYGRKRILLGSVLLFGLFSIATALALPARANTWPLPPPGSRLVGQNQFHVVENNGGSLEAIAKKYNVGFLALLQANPGVDPYVPRAGSVLTIPLQTLLPLSLIHI